jgi:tetratricopeptide (TPR) repeat protein
MWEQTNNQEELNLLLKATKNDAFRFIMIQYNHEDLMRECITRLQNEYPQKSFETFDCIEKDIALLVPEVLKSKSDIYFIKHFYKIFEEENQSFAIGFNQRRDRLSNRNGQIIAFVPSGNNWLRTFQKKMPDLSSITNIILNFEMEIITSFKNQLIAPTEYHYNNIPDAQTEIDRIIKRLKDLDTEPENLNLWAKLHFNLAKAYNFIGQSEKAKEILTNLEPQIKDYTDLLDTFYNEYGLVLQVLGDYAQAKIYFNKALDYNLKHFGKNHLETAINYSNLALVLRDLGEFEQAKIYLEIALQTEEEILGIKHPKTADCYSNLGLVLIDLGDFVQAKIYFEKAFQSDINNFGKNHPNTAISLDNLARIYRILGDFNQARIYVEKALNSDISNFGENHSNTGIGYVNLAMVLMDLGEYDKAKEFSEKALKIMTNTLGENHPNTQIVKENLESLLKKHF